MKKRVVVSLVGVLFFTLIPCNLQASVTAQLTVRALQIQIEELPLEKQAEIKEILDNPLAPVLWGLVKFAVASGMLIIEQLYIPNDVMQRLSQGTLEIKDLRFFTAEILYGSVHFLEFLDLTVDIISSWRKPQSPSQENVFDDVDAISINEKITTLKKHIEQLSYRERSQLTQALSPSQLHFIKGIITCGLLMRGIAASEVNFISNIAGFMGVFYIFGILDLFIDLPYLTKILLKQKTKALKKSIPEAV